MMIEESVFQSSDSSIDNKDQTKTNENSNARELNEPTQTTADNSPEQAKLVPTATTNTTNRNPNALIINSQLAYYQAAPYIPLQSPSLIYSQVPPHYYANVSVWEQQQVQSPHPPTSTFDTYFNYYLVPFNNSGATLNIIPTAPNSVYYNPSAQPNHFLDKNPNDKHKNNTQCSLSSNSTNSSNNTSRKNSYSNENTKSKVPKAKNPNRPNANERESAFIHDEGVFVSKPKKKSVENGKPHKKYSEVVASGETNKSNNNLSKPSNSIDSNFNSTTAHVTNLNSSEVSKETDQKSEYTNQTKSKNRSCANHRRVNYNSYESSGGFLYDDNYAYHPVDQSLPFIVSEFGNLNLYSPTNSSSALSNGHTIQIVSQPVPFWEYNYATALVAGTHLGNYNPNRHKTKHEATYQTNGISGINSNEFYYNGEQDGDPNRARFFVIKSYSKEDVVLSIKHGYWCSTESGNSKLNQAFEETKSIHGSVYLLFSINSSGEFCGLAEMTSNVDLSSNLEIWSQNKWKGKFSVKWIYVKNVPNNRFRHIVLANNDNKPVTNSRDTQEIPFEQAVQVLNIYRDFRHKTSILDDAKTEPAQSTLIASDKKKQKAQESSWIS